MGKALLAALGLSCLPLSFSRALKVTDAWVEERVLTSTSPVTFTNTRTNNDPRIEFEQRPGFSTNPDNLGTAQRTSARLCANIDEVADELTIDIIKFDGVNCVSGALNEGCNPVRTFQFPNPTAGDHCDAWEGDYNILGEFGKTNGQYGFKATAQIITTSTATGTLQETHVFAFPGAGQDPLSIDVVNIHVVRSSPTVVGNVTPVAAAPYNITFRLSKAATTTLDIIDTQTGNKVRDVVFNLPNQGEIEPDGTLTVGFSWDARDNSAVRVSSGIYTAVIHATNTDFFGLDHAVSKSRQIAVDPLQITDVSVSPLQADSTALALLSFMTAEPMEITWRIYHPSTTFDNVNNPIPQPTAGTLLREFVEQKPARLTEVMFWDGRDSAGNFLTDGNYKFVLFGRDLENPIRTTSKPTVSTVEIKRGFVDISQLQPQSTTIGTAPSINAVAPFTFSYSMSREGIVSLRILKPLVGGATQFIRTLVNGETRSGNTLIVDPVGTGGWDGKDQFGSPASSGTYAAELTVRDPVFTNRVTTTTVFFPIQLFRITDVATSPLISDSTAAATLTYQLSEGGTVFWRIYPPGTDVVTNWPFPNPSGVSSVRTLSGFRPGRKKITEFWDGRNEEGLFVPDGDYVSTLIFHEGFGNRSSDLLTPDADVARGQIVFTVFQVIPTLPQLFNSSQTITLPPFEIDYTVTRESTVTIRVIQNDTGQTARTIISGQVRFGNILNKEFWDARDDQGRFVRPGLYTVKAVAQDFASVTASTSTAQATVSVDPLRIYDVSIQELLAPGGEPRAQISYQVSEAMKVAVQIYKPGTLTNGFGNENLLVRKFVGFRPSRTLIREFWDGTNEAKTRLENGAYVFRIIASTASNAIDDEGNVVAGAQGLLVPDQIVSELSVVQVGSADPQGDFEKNTIVFPNPLKNLTLNVTQCTQPVASASACNASTPSSGDACFLIALPLKAQLNFKLYTLSGEMVRSESCGIQGDASELSYVYYLWRRDNQAGNRVTGGVYFAVFRAETTEGDQKVLQTVRNILIP
ncbi:MAG: hypothetical protein HY402_07195 [Elusimicrobia bacterium]|nr:hypothetical protein [Elusimicrobiota bacterium]